MKKFVYYAKLIKDEIKRLDEKTGLNGSSRPFVINNEIHTLAAYKYRRGKEAGVGDFVFSEYYFNDPNWPIEEAKDTVRHEYAHFMDATKNGFSSHGASWKKCCNITGAIPIAYYLPERADYYQKKHKEAEYRAKKCELYIAGMKIEHPVFGIGEITKISGKGEAKIAFVTFSDDGSLQEKKLSVLWISDNCKIV